MLWSSAFRISILPLLESCSLCITMCAQEINLCKFGKQCDELRTRMVLAKDDEVVFIA